MSDSEILETIFEENVETPTRDGTVLRANIARPVADGQYPVIVERTPYGKTGRGIEEFAKCGYVVVSQDVRGRYASDGEWIPFTQEDTGDAEDGYDLVEWAAAQSWSNGKVGAMGCSYPAWMCWQLAKLRPPHLIAMAARSISRELTALDWPGAFKPGRRIKWWLNTMAPDLRRRHGMSKPHTTEEARVIWDEVEHARWLGLHPWSKIAKYLPPGLAEHAEDWLKHPNRRAWKFEDAHKEVEVPNLDVSGWYDHVNDSIYHLPGMQANGRSEVARTQTKLIAGPWSHVALGQRQQGGVDFGEAAEMNMAATIISWFDHWLKDEDNGVDKDPAVRYFVMGSGEWRSAGTWPPEGHGSKELFLGSGGDASASAPGELSDVAGSSSGESDSYEYDPDNPVPTLWSERLFTEAPDRRRLEYREDILYYMTAVLEEDLEIAGDPEVLLCASSSAPDTDFFARLVDDDPDGIALEVSYGMVCARHRNSLDEEDFLTPGKVTEFRIKLGPTACCFKKGHRIRLEITSSDFPNHDRNHNVGRNDLFDAETVTATQTIFHSSAHPSKLILPVRAG